jgi:hypothetical protein
LSHSLLSRPDEFPQLEHLAIFWFVLEDNVYYLFRVAGLLLTFRPAFSLECQNPTAAYIVFERILSIFPIPRAIATPAMHDI